MDHDVAVFVTTGEKDAFDRLALLETFSAERTVPDDFLYRTGFGCFCRSAECRQDQNQNND
jgi:hypothetical protein